MILSTAAAKHPKISWSTGYWTLDNPSLDNKISWSTGYWTLDDPSLDNKISWSTGYWTLDDPSLDKEISRSTGYWTLDDPKFISCYVLSTYYRSLRLTQTSYTIHSVQYTLVVNPLLTTIAHHIFSSVLAEPHQDQMIYVHFVKDQVNNIYHWLIRDWSISSMWFRSIAFRCVI